MHSGRFLFTRLHLMTADTEWLNVARFVPAAIGKGNDVVDAYPLGDVDESAVSAPGTARAVDRSAKSTAGRLATGVACSTSSATEALRGTGSSVTGTGAARSTVHAEPPRAVLPFTYYTPRATTSDQGFCENR